MGDNNICNKASKKTSRILLLIEKNTNFHPHNFRKEVITKTIRQLIDAGW